MVNDPEYLRWLARYERQATTPASVVKIWDVNFDIDIRSILPTIRVPTLVIHHTHEPLSVENGRYLAAKIPGARFLELPGEDHLPWLGDQDSMLDAIEEFVTGRPAQLSTDHVLATVLFTDVVDSTRRATAIGDVAWRRLLDDHDVVTARVVREGSGQVIKQTGDGALATFDSPTRAIATAGELHHALQPLDLRIRAGLHTGEIERRGSDISGIGVNIAARVQALGTAGETLASSTVKDLCAGAGFSFEDYGTHELKGVDGAWSVYRLAG
jgi:class 3 adenylate cyclase